MNKTELFTAVENCKSETKDALQAVYDALNNGQQKKLLKDERVKALLVRYGVVAEDGE